MEGKEGGGGAEVWVRVKTRRTLLRKFRGDLGFPLNIEVQNCY